ncbi:MAG: ABC transporter substrate-binding protein, partial [Verrucomicrobiota bacterium]|nr:ABC transporter substrate-binding protein [Verrucomicrobiota bacterium]
MDRIIYIGYYWIALCVFSPVPVMSAPLSPPPAAKLKFVVESAIDAFYSTEYGLLPIEDKHKKVSDVIESNYDMTILIRRAVGRNWSLMNSAQQEKIVALIKVLVLRTYADGLTGTVRPSVDFLDAVEVSDKRIEVPSIMKLDNQKFYVLYRLGLTRTGWQIYDIVVEGISIVSNYRQQFADHFRRGTTEELIKKLENMVKEGA